MDTKKIAVIPVDEKTFADYKDTNLKKVISKTNDEFAENLAPLFNAFQDKFKNKEWIYLTRAGQSEGVYYVHNIAGLMPDLDVHGCQNAYSYRPITYNDSNILNPSRLVFAGFQGVIPTSTEAKKLFNDQINYFRDGNGNVKVCGTARSGITVDSGGNYMWTRNDYKYNVYSYNCSQTDYFWVMPIYKFGLSNPSAQKVIWTWLEFDLSPTKFPSDKAQKLFSLLKKYKDFLKLQGDKITFDEKKLYDGVKAGTKFDFLNLDFLKAKNIDGKEFETAFREELLSCDNIRVALDRYDEKILTDPNRGHWDLWDLPEAGERGIKLSETVYARDPAADVNASGIVGIDFGTKSTVVVYENERGEIIPLQVGAGDYSKGIKARNYENPTIIEFRHIENFLAAYTARAGRPKTSWNDVTVSHNAQENLKDTSDSSLFASFFENIKQWCGNIQYTTKIRDHDGTEKDLPPFLDITKDEFNPLEYYAYYLGSYINHMLRPNHIFLKYILSFPVMYERNIRERMLKAFRAGVLKSLPTALLDNEEAMKNFQMVEGTSEPAAYAITALEGYGFLNGEELDDGIYYSVFDFGGGTTDFDFGVLKLAEDEDADFYDYVLTHFGAHGDRTLGGENLLRLMAFHVFKANSEKLLKPRDDNPQVKIPFTWAAEKMEFAGSEGLIRSSQEANLNMHNLMEVLRSIWEAPQSDEAKKILESGTVSVTVFDDAGQEITEFKLSIGSQTIPEEVKPQRKFEPAPPPAPTPPKETNFEVSKAKFDDIVLKAWDGDFTAFNILEDWALLGHKESIAELKELAKNGSNYAKDILNKLAAPKSAPAPTPEPKVEPKKVAPTVDLIKILRERISRGIDNFFISLRDAFDKVSGGEDNGVAALSDVEAIGIFLAGNSTKSALVKKLFEEYTNEETGKARELLGFGKGQKMPRFILYPPLGTDDADKIQEESGLTVDKNNFARPTGKTGVAFGLLRCREGSAIRVVDITPEGKDKKQVPFQFYVGRARMGKFKIVIDKSTKLGKWCKFIGAKLGVFDLLYTDESIAATNNAPASIAKRLTIHVDADPEASVYIQAVESNKIRYAVSKGEPAAEVEGKLITLD
ncbi:MAG: hypothetical protein IKZ53_06780 [Selenomonadaceae bacterium]|nr:hypothetical protein [Selenomonadaceae bacterium]